MTDILTIVAWYMFVGVLALALLDLLTGRIRSKLKSASYETQKRLISAGSYVGPKLAIGLTVFAMWMFWPLVIYAAVESQIRGGKDGAQG